MFTELNEQELLSVDGGLVGAVIGAVVGIGTLYCVVASEIRARGYRDGQLAAYEAMKAK